MLLYKKLLLVTFGTTIVDNCDAWKCKISDYHAWPWINVCFENYNRKLLSACVLWLARSIFACCFVFYVQKFVGVSAFSISHLDLQTVLRFMLSLCYFAPCILVQLYSISQQNARLLN